MLSIKPNLIGAAFVNRLPLTSSAREEIDVSSVNCVKSSSVPLSWNVPLAVAGISLKAL